MDLLNDSSLGGHFVDLVNLMHKETSKLVDLLKDLQRTIYNHTVSERTVLITAEDGFSMKCAEVTSLDKLAIQVIPLKSFLIDLVGNAIHVRRGKEAHVCILCGYPFDEQPQAGEVPQAGEEPQTGKKLLERRESHVISRYSLEAAYDMIYSHNDNQFVTPESYTWNLLCSQCERLTIDVEKKQEDTRRMLIDGEAEYCAALYVAGAHFLFRGLMCNIDWFTVFENEVCQDPSPNPSRFLEIILSAYQLKQFCQANTKEDHYTPNQDHQLVYIYVAPSNIGEGHTAVHPLLNYHSKNVRLTRHCVGRISKDMEDGVCHYLSTSYSIIHFVAPCNRETQEMIHCRYNEERTNLFPHFLKSALCQEVRQLEEVCKSIMSSNNIKCSFVCVLDKRLYTGVPFHKIGKSINQEKKELIQWIEKAVQKWPQISSFIVWIGEILQQNESLSEETVHTLWQNESLSGHCQPVIAAIPLPFQRELMVSD